MKKLVMVPSFLLATSFLTACSGGFNAAQLDQELQRPINANATAANYKEWHFSKDSADNVTSSLIQKYMAKELTADQVCDSFDRLSAHDLTLYEEKIHSKTYEVLFQNCKESLVSKLDDYWNSQRAKLKIPLKKTTSNPDIIEDKTLLRRFEKPVQVVRDVSQGYFAVTGDLEPGQVALTFDDGPHESYTYEVLEALADANVKATFFVMGNNVRKNPEVLKAEARAGHSIGTHSNDHLCQTDTDYCQKSNSGKRLSVYESINNISLGHKAVKDILGWVFPFFRFPYGEGSADLKKFLKTSGTGEFFWSVDSNDWRNYIGKEKTPYTAVDMVEAVKSQLSIRKRGIVLNHDIQKKTAVGLPALLNWLHEQGMQPVAFIPMDKNSLVDSGLMKAAEQLRLQRAASAK